MPRLDSKCGAWHNGAGQKRKETEDLCRMCAKLLSWNVNGIRALMTKGLSDIFHEMDADIFCFQETKASPEQANFTPPGYLCFWNCAEKKGYSGTAIYSKKTPLSVRLGLGDAAHDTEGRLLTLEFEDYFVVNVYSPNSKPQLERLAYRQIWEEAFRTYLKTLRESAHKGVIVCGDLNVAHEEIDLAHPAANRFSAGFTDEERGCFTRLLAAGFTDSYRFLHPDTRGAYTWWSYRTNARARGVGWRLDYFLVSDDLRPRVCNAKIHADIMGSDHCPVGITLR
jgi:exodeoxyribonuclease-3